MRDELVKHYFQEMVNNWLLNLAARNPSVPLSAVVQNYLYFPDNTLGNTDTRPRIEVDCENLYEATVLFQGLPDEVAYSNELVDKLATPFFIDGFKLEAFEDDKPIAG